MRCTRRFAAVTCLAMSLVTPPPACAEPIGPVLAAALRAAAEAARADGEMPAAAPAQPGWATRHPVLVGMVAGTVVGAGLSQVDAIGGRNHDIRVAFVGTAVGAWGGLVASAVHKARTGQRVGTGTRIGIVAGAVAMVVVPLVACYAAGGCGGTS